MDIVETIERLEVITDISPNDRTYTADAEQYFFVGKSAMLTIIAATNARVLHAAGAAPLRTIVEFGAGYGRVTRWIRAAFPEADIHLVEGDEEALRWSCEKFGCRPLGDDLSGQRFDLIWAGAALAHSPQPIAESLLERLTRAVGPGGILLFATHGRYSALRLQGWDWSRIDKPWVHYGLGRGIELALEGYRNTGYGFAAYADNDQHGISIARPGWYARRVTADTEFTQLLFQEKGWDNHLDVHAYIRSSILSEERGPLKNVGFRTNVTFRRRPTRHLEPQSTSTTDRTVSEAVVLREVISRT